MDKPLILVTLGTTSYPFDRLCAYIARDPLYYSEDCEWFIQCGVTKVIRNPLHGKVVKYVSRDKIESLMKRSSLVISHGGVGSIYEMLKFRKLGVFVPRIKKYREYSDDHQLQIARMISNKKVNVVYPEDEFPKLDLTIINSECRNSIPIDIVNYELAKHIKSELNV